MRSPSDKTGPSGFTPAYFPLWSSFENPAFAQAVRAQISVAGLLGENCLRSTAPIAPPRAGRGRIQEEVAPPSSKTCWPTSSTKNRA
jgi:hypothetical protein